MARDVCACPEFKPKNNSPIGFVLGSERLTRQIDVVSEGDCHRNLKAKKLCSKFCLLK